VVVYPFGARAHTETPTVTEPDAKAVRCSCPDSPWCTGPSGPYWLRCATTCRSCHPRPRRRRAGEHLRGEQDG
jgi:hypothetical protein